MKRFEQALLISTFSAFCWLAMQVIHEAGHVLLALSTGGEVIKVALHMRWNKIFFSSCTVVTVCMLAGAGCASSSTFRLTADSPTERAQIAHLLRDIFDAAEAKDLVKLDSYHWYGSKFSKFGSDSSGRQDAADARQGEHDGLTALNGLKMQAGDLKIDVLGDVAITTFIADVSFKLGPDVVQKQERATMVFVKHQGNWKITHEHFSAFKPKP